MGSLISVICSIFSVRVCMNVCDFLYVRVRLSIRALIMGVSVYEYSCMCVRGIYK